ncbi:MAG: trypsin-like peptidase domain-containing protein [Desulfobacteraceae bacterium]|nr:trypsin-like peptidase domain-containing protein [Desulfobacteraceae bacterium]
MRSGLVLHTFLNLPRDHSTHPQSARAEVLLPGGSCEQSEPSVRSPRLLRRTLSGAIRHRGFLLLLFLLGTIPGVYLPIPARALTPDEMTTIAAFEKVAPSVVNISTEICEPEYFYCAVPSKTGAGSGVVMKEDGLIVTNHHVVASAKNIRVTLTDGRRLNAEIVASDPNEDLAVIRVDPGGRPLQAIVFGDSDKVRVGERVFAVGNPFGLGQTLTAGSVSMTGRSLRDEGRIMRDLIQTDAPINPGNSGGALVNSSGDLIGLCTAILSPTGTSIRIGFALPSNRIRAITPTMVRPWPKILGWTAALLVAVWFIKKVYGRRAGTYPPGF